MNKYYGKCRCYKTEISKEPTKESDGLRILVARYRPRCMRKDDENNPGYEITHLFICLILTH
ncbi:MAG: hypothetical protein P0116_06945 [Candidatus Nitrosocosmicus sp.]|nr:hypothetical protein [Candidatus Nitrosocosmicus sp.]